MLLLLAMLLGPADEEILRPVEVARMTHRQALYLTGAVRTYRVRLNTVEDTEGGFVLFGCDGPDEGAMYSVWFPKDTEAIPDDCAVEARLKVIHHQDPKVVEYRLIVVRLLSPG